MVYRGFNIISLIIPIVVFIIFLITGCYALWYRRRYMMRQSNAPRTNAYVMNQTTGPYNSTSAGYYPSNVPGYSVQQAYYPAGAAVYPQTNIGTHPASNFKQYPTAGVGEGYAHQNVSPNPYPAAPPNAFPTTVNYPLGSATAGASAAAPPSYEAAIVACEAKTS